MCIRDRVKEDKLLAIIKQQEQEDAIVELQMLRQQVQQAQQQIQNSQQQAKDYEDSARVVKDMLDTGAAKIGKEGGIIVQPAQGAFEYGMVNQNKMLDDQQPKDDEQQEYTQQQIQNAVGGNLFK